MPFSTARPGEPTPPTSDANRGPTGVLEVREAAGGGMYAWVTLARGHHAATPLAKEPGAPSGSTPCQGYRPGSRGGLGGPGSQLRPPPPPPT